MVTPLTESRGDRLAVIICAGILMWAVSIAVARRRPRIPSILAALVAAAIAWGALLAFNSRARYAETAHTLEEATRRVAWLPGSVDRAASVRSLAQVATVLVATLVLIDLARSERYRRVALWAIAGNAALISVVGVAGRADVFTLFDHPGTEGGTPFAAFGYHGNAAAYLDLGLPAALALVIVGERRFTRTVAMFFVAAILAGAATGASKAGLVAALVIALLFTLVMTRRVPGREDRDASASSARTTRVRIGILALLLLVGVVGATLSRDRWIELPDELGAHNGRVSVWNVALHIWDDHPVAGSGPGTFKLLLPDVAAAEERQLFSRWIVSDYVSGQPVTIWMYAHNDALQTLSEWGVIGALLLGAILMWPLARGLPLGPDRRTRAVRAGGVLAVGMLYAHALVDFPLQIFAIQLTAGLWAAILIGGSGTRGSEEPSALGSRIADRTPR
jgi:O-antigen ligase